MPYDMVQIVVIDLCGIEISIIQPLKFDWIENLVNLALVEYSPGSLDLDDI
jgi:hypothetical protein